MTQVKDNSFGKCDNPAVNQIISRILTQHFDKSPERRKTIGEIEDEMMAHVQQRAKIVDFANGETCEFK